MPSKIKRVVPYLSLATVMLLLAMAGRLLADTEPLVKDAGDPKPTAFLFVGNSFMYYNNGMQSHFRRLAQAQDAENRSDYRTTLATISGSSLSWHDVASYFRPDALAEFSFVAGNKVRFNDFDQLFDAVIMMDCSQCPIHPQLADRFHAFAAKHSATVREHGAQPILFMTWAYEDEPEMTASLAAAYTRAGNANNALVVPAGLAFAKARAGRPDLRLTTADLRHPTPAGTYLGALTIYAAIYAQSPVGAAAPDGVDTDAARFLQEVAWQTVRDYYGRK